MENENNKIEQIPRPSKKEADYYINKFITNNKYSETEKALNKLFLENNDNEQKIEDILIKIACLNQIYSTNIPTSSDNKPDINDVAHHILNMKSTIDKRLKNGDLTLVNDLAQIIVEGKPKVNKEGKEKEEQTPWNYYSFATKYCSHHSSDVYPIYDSYVSKILLHFNKKYNFYDSETKIKDDDLRDYIFFNKLLDKFVEYFDLKDDDPKKYSKKNIDRYLWSLGKEHYAPKPKKEKQKLNGSLNIN